MRKSIYCTLLLFLSSVACMAQDFVGKWQAPMIAVEEMLGKGGDLVFEFQQNNTFVMKAKIVQSVNEGSLTLVIKAEVSVPGIYEVKSNGKLKLVGKDAKIDNLDVSVPGATPEQEKQIKTIVKSEANSILDAKDIKSISKICNGSYKYYVSGEVLNIDGTPFTKI